MVGWLPNKTAVSNFSSPNNCDVEKTVCAYLFTRVFSTSAV